MGSVGNKEATSNVIDARDKFIQQPNSEPQQNSNLWDYRGEVEAVDRLQSQVNRAQSPSQIQRIALEVRREDIRINSLIEQEQNGQVDVKGDVNVLLTQRRRLRAMMRELESKF